MENSELVITIVIGTLIPVLVSFIIGYYLSIIIEKKKRRDRKQEYIKSLISEFQFLTDTFEKKTETVTEENNILSIKYSEYKTPFLTSLINAGLFHEFSDDLQRQLAKVNGLISYYNSLSFQIIQTATLSPRDIENINKNVETLNTGLNKTMKDLKDEIKILMNLLKKYQS